MTAFKKYRLALKLYREQNHQDPDHKIAALLYESAYLGNKYAQFLLPFWGLDYFCNSSQTSLYWYEKSGRGGHPYAQYCHAIKILEKADRDNLDIMEAAISQALTWLQEAAATGGVTAAAFLLNNVYRVGLWGLEVNMVQADYWLEIAKKNRNQYDQIRKQRKANGNTIMPEDWDLKFHRDSLFILNESDLEKWHQYINTQMKRRAI